MEKTLLPVTNVEKHQHGRSLKVYIYIQGLPSWEPLLICVTPSLLHLDLKVNDKMLSSHLATSLFSFSLLHGSNWQRHVRPWILGIALWSSMPLHASPSIPPAVSSIQQPEMDDPSSWPAGPSPFQRPNGYSDPVPASCPHRQKALQSTYSCEQFLAHHGSEQRHKGVPLGAMEVRMMEWRVCPQEALGRARYCQEKNTETENRMASLQNYHLTEPRYCCMPFLPVEHLGSHKHSTILKCTQLTSDVVHLHGGLHYQNWNAPATSEGDFVNGAPDIEVDWMRFLLKQYILQCQNMRVKQFTVRCTKRAKPTTHISHSLQRKVRECLGYGSMC